MRATYITMIDGCDEPFVARDLHVKYVEFNQGILKVHYIRSDGILDTVEFTPEDCTVVAIS